MRRFLGAAPQRKSTSNGDDNDVLAQLNESKELIEKRQEHLTRKVDHEIREAMRWKQANRKNEALACLKRKKLIEDELAGLTQQRLKLDSQEHALSSLKFHATTLAVERAATAAIKAKIANEGGVEKMEQQREETEETLEDAYELLGVASQPLTLPGMGGMDDDELLAELEEMEEAEERKRLDESLLKVDEVGATSAGPSHAPFPTAPQAALSSTISDEERELAELDALAASMRIERPMPMLQTAPLVQVA